MNLEKILIVDVVVPSVFSVTPHPSITIRQDFFFAAAILSCNLKSPPPPPLAMVTAPRSPRPFFPSYISYFMQALETVKNTCIKIFD